MKSSSRVFITFGILVVLIVGLYLFSDWFSKATGYVLGEDQQVAFVDCLRNKASVLYTQSDCVACFKQQEVFAPSAFDLLTVVSCDSVDCSNLESIPSWEIDGKFYSGMYDFKQLSELSGCPLGS